MQVKILAVFILFTSGCVSLSRHERDLHEERLKTIYERSEAYDTGYRIGKQEGVETGAKICASLGSNNSEPGGRSLSEILDRAELETDIRFVSDPSIPDVVRRVLQENIQRLHRKLNGGGK